MKTGDTVRLKYTENTGTIVREISPRWYKVIFTGVFGGEAVSMRDDDIELLCAAPIVNPCVCCGAETPEGRQVCGVCEKS